MSGAPTHLGVFAFFEALPDPGVERTRPHPLLSVFSIALLATICSGDGWDDMEEFGEAKADWLRTFLELPNGIPSADTFRRVPVARRGRCVEISRDANGPTE